MATAVKTCRVCGKQYEACRTMMNRAAGVFRLRVVLSAAQNICVVSPRHATQLRPPPSVGRGARQLSSFLCNRRFLRSSLHRQTSQLKRLWRKSEQSVGGWSNPPSPFL